jgi:hypothetical protein
MRTKCIIISIGVLLANDMQGTEGIKWFQSNNWWDIISFTSTNVTYRFKGKQFVSQKGVIRLSEHNEEFSLTHDQETMFTDGRHIEIYFTPITLKNKQNGFRNTVLNNLGAYEYKGITTNYTYVALGDKPIEMREEDVEMILEKGEWIKYKKGRPISRRVQTLPPPKPESKSPPESELKRRLREVVAEMEAIARTNPAAAEKGIVVDRPRGWFDIPADMPAIVPDAESDSIPAVDDPKPANRWLYILIPLCLFPALYFLRRKLKTRNEK